MEFTHELTAYSVRIDCNKEFSTTFLEILYESKPELYFFGKESGSLTKKPHFQGCVWYADPLGESQIVKLRNKIRRFITKNLIKPELSKRWQPISFKKARHNTLLSYCAKDSTGFETNLSDEQVASIPQWKTKPEFDSSKKEDLERRLKIACETNHYPFTQFAVLFADCYLSIYDKPCSRRNLYYAAALRHGIIPTEEYLYLIGVTKPDISYSCDNVFPISNYTKDLESIVHDNYL